MEKGDPLITDTLDALSQGLPLGWLSRFRGYRNPGDSDRIQPFTESSEVWNQSKCSYNEKRNALSESYQIRPITESSEFSSRQPRPGTFLATSSTRNLSALICTASYDVASNI